MTSARPRIAVVVASRHGSTRGIADALVECLGRHGVDATVHDADGTVDLEGVDGVVLGSAVYMGRWLAPAREFARSHGPALGERPLWLFSSGPLGPPGELKPEGDSPEGAALAVELGALEHHTLAGSLDRASLSLRERAIVKAVHAPYGDFRDRAEIDRLAESIAARVSLPAAVSIAAP